MAYGIVSDMGPWGDGECHCVVCEAKKNMTPEELAELEAQEEAPPPKLSPLEKLKTLDASGIKWVETTGPDWHTCPHCAYGRWWFN